MNKDPKTNDKLSTIKKMVYFLLMMAVSTCLSLFFAELVIRIFFPQKEAMRWYLSSDRYGYVMKKNFTQRYNFINSNFVMDVKTNSLGHRDREHDLSEFSRSDIKKILLIGDSFTFGLSVNTEDSFNTKLEKLLNQGDEKFIVINTGVGGWGTLQAITYAKDHFDLFNPDIIILTFCGNDPDDDVRFKCKIRDRDKGLFYFPGKAFIRYHSHLYRFVYSKLGVFVHNLVLKRKAEQSNQNAQLDKQSGSIITEDEWNRTFQYIRRFHRDFREFNPDGVLLIQASGPWNRNIREHLRSIMIEGSLIYVDLYDDVKLLKAEQTGLPHDGDHWSPLMHSISAMNLYECILKLNFSSSYSPVICK